MRGSSYNKARMCTVKVLRQLGFDASLLRSAAVAVEAEAPSNTAMLFVRGAPSVIGQLVSPDTLPADYRQVNSNNNNNNNKNDSDSGK